VGLLKKSQIDSFRIQNERKQRSYRHVLPENVYCWGFSTGPLSPLDPLSGIELNLGEQSAFGGGVLLMTNEEINMAKKEVTISVTEITVVQGKKKSVRINIDGQTVNVPVDESVFTYFKEQFIRENPTPLQKKRFATVMNVLRAAYLKGLADGKNSQ
jgi:hypothetical protein